jgi:TorA maturation chaperone TorD
MIGDRDLLAFRLGYYDLFVSLLWKEPAGELLTALAEGIVERIGGARHVHPLLGEGWEAVARFLEGADRTGLVEGVAEEYTRLFLGPDGPRVNPYESYYLTGRLWDRPLAVLRRSVRALGLEKQAGYAEPEDFLAFELDVMRRLIGRQAAAPDGPSAARALDLQATFLKRHLLVWAPAAAGDLFAAEGARFYRGVARLLEGFLDLERELFAHWGSEPLRTLDEVRRSFGGMAEWRGPLVDLGAGPGDKPGGRQT